eukprot:scaffold31230_cov19-Tisochrysis_lutea.AAC.6
MQACAFWLGQGNFMPFAMYPAAAYSFALQDNYRLIRQTHIAASEHSKEFPFSHVPSKQAAMLNMPSRPHLDDVESPLVAFPHCRTR